MSETKPPELPDAWSATLHGGERPDATIKSSSRPPEGAQPTALPQSQVSFDGATALPSGSEPTYYPSRPGAAPPGPPAPGSASGPQFQVLRVLGQGGMGVVYAARQGSLSRDIALKMITAPPEQLPALEPHFVSEAMVTGDLDHPNIVPVHDLGRDAQGNLYMAMKLVRGESWDKRIKRPPAEGVTPRRALRDQLEILLKVCDAVAFAHSRHVVHRDLKPENVMVGEFGEVLVMDWGIALDVSEPPQPGRKAESKLSASPCAGTPRYMAPEVARAQGAAIGPATDVYLLGGILYELLTGTPPHLKGETISELLQTAAKGQVELPERRAPGRAIPRELARIAMKALSVEPAERYPDAAAFQQALRDFLAHEDSLRLAEEGQALVDKLAEPGAVLPAERYAAYTRALGRFSDALHLWPHNSAAQSGQAKAAQGLADEAIDRGDVGLAATQLEVLRSNKAVDPGRRAALEAAVARGSASRWRSLTMAGLSVLALLGLVEGAVTWREHLDVDRAVRETRLAQGAKAVTGWHAAQAQDLRGLRQALAGPLAQAAPAVGPKPEDGLAWAEQVLLWSQGRWLELAERLPPPEAADFGSRLMGRAELAQSPMAAQLQVRPDTEVSSAAPPPPSPERAWAALVQQARQGLRAAALDATLEELDRASAQVGPGSPFAPARRALRQAAVVELAHQAALARGDAAEAARLEPRRAPFALLEAPIGQALGAPSEPPRLAVVSTNLVAYEPATGRERWRRPFASSDAVSATAVPLPDGSALVAARGELLRLAPADGRVLGREPLDGQALLAWPDPVDRRRVVVAVFSDDRRGWVHLLRFTGGKAEDPRFFASRLAESAGTTGYAGLLKAALQKELLAQPGSPGPATGSGALAEREPWLRPRVAARMEEAAGREPGNAALWIFAADDGGPAGSPRRQALLARAWEARPTTPLTAAVLGVKLESLGERAEAERYYALGAQLYAAQLGNTATDVGLIESPVLNLRKLGGDVFATDPARALELVERGRDFSDYAEGDHRFYRMYARYLAEQGKSAAAERLGARVTESENPGGAFMLPSSYLLSLDIALVLLLCCGAVLVALAARLWWAGRRARLADLYALGYRTGAQRLAAFLTDPVGRLRLSSWAYSTRAERLLLVLVGSTFLASAAVAIHRVQAVGEVAAMPGQLVAGVAGHPELLDVISERQADRSQPSAGALRLLAEGRHARGEEATAREQLGALLALVPGDARALNNLALLDEAQGDLASARARLAQAGAAPGAEGAPARWNQARLAGDAAGQRAAEAELAHRDGVPARLLGPGQSLWARASYDDLYDALIGARSLAREIRDGVVQVVGSGFRELGGIFGLQEVGADDGPPLLKLGTVLGYFTLVVTALAFLWLALPVRPREQTGPPPSRARIPWRLLLALPGLALPGAWELLFGSAAGGAGALFALGAGAALFNTIRYGGVLGNLATPALNRGYFPEQDHLSLYPELQRYADAAALVIGLLFVLNLGLAAWRLRSAWLERRDLPAER